MLVRVKKLKTGKCPKGASMKRRGRSRRSVCFITKAAGRKGRGRRRSR